MNSEEDKKLREHLREIDPDIVIYDNLNGAIVGMCARFGQPPILLYDLDVCIDILAEEADSYEAAVEHFEYNTLGTWAGDHTPAFISRFTEPAIPLANYIREVKSLMKRMSDEERETFIAEIGTEFCLHCGARTLGNEHCTCTRDD